MMNKNGRDFKDSFFFNYVCGYENVCQCVCECAGSPGGQKKVLNFMEVELQAIVRCLIGLLGTELESSVRAVSADKY